MQAEISLKVGPSKYRKCYQIKPFPSLACKYTINCWVAVLK